MDRASPTPLAVRACAAALTLCAAASAVYAATRFIQAIVPHSSPYPTEDSVIDGSFAVLAVVGYAAATYGVLTHRWGARQLGLLVSGAFLPYGALAALFAYVNLFGYAWRDPVRTLLLVANCIALTAAMAGAVIGLASLWRRRVADHFTVQVAVVPDRQVQRMLLRARLLLVTVALVTTGVFLWLALLAGRSQFADDADPLDRIGPMVALLVIFLLLLVPGLLCVVSAALLPRRPSARRMGLVGLWASALLGVPLMVLLASFMVPHTATPEPDQLVWTLGSAIALLCELIGFFCVVSAVLLLNHPDLQARLTHRHPGLNASPGFTPGPGPGPDSDPGSGPGVEYRLL